MRLVRNVVLLGLAALIAGAAWAQDSDNSEFYMGIRQTSIRLESVYPSRYIVMPEEIMAPDPNQYTIKLDASEALSLRRSFTREAVELQAAPLGFGFNEKLETGVELNLGARTAMSFANTTTMKTDFRGVALDSTKVSTYGLTQSFGQGSSAGTMAFNRTVTEKSAYLAPSVTTRYEQLKLDTGLWDEYALSFSTSRTNEDRVGGLQAKDLAFLLKVPFSGGVSPLGFASTEKVQGSSRIETEKIDLAMPLAFRGGQAIAEYHSDLNVTNGVEKRTRTTHFALPYGLLGRPGGIDHSILGVDKGQGMVETRTTKLVNPFRLGDREFGAEESWVSLRQAGTYTETFTALLTAPLAGGNATIQRQDMTTLAGSSAQEQRQLAITLPSFRMFDKVTVTGQRVSTENLGQSDVDVTNLSIAVQPLKPLQIEARYTLDDHGPSQATKSTQFHTKWNLADKLSLQGKFTEAEVLGNSSNTLRFVELVRDRSGSGLGLTAGLASYGSPTTVFDDAKRVEMVLGKATGVALSASYSEYDTGNLTRYTDDAQVRVVAEHGDPNRFLLRWRYEDVPARVAPIRAMDMVLPALGGSLQVSYAANPPAPWVSNKVREADQYDATLDRSIFGDVSLKLGYRYVDYSEDAGVDQWVKLQLSGGTEQSGGKVTMNYFTGDFCEPKSNQLAPGSLFDLSYSKRWSDLGTLTLTLRRQTPPLNTFGENDVTGQLQYDLKF